MTDQPLDTNPDAGDVLSPEAIEAILAGHAGETAAEPVPPAAPSTGTALMPVPPEPVVEDVVFDPLHEIEAPLDRPAGIEVLLEVPLQVTVELGQTTVTIRELLELGQGSILRLNRHAGEPVDLLVNGRRLARGEVVVMEEDFGLRVTDVVSPADRLQGFGE